MNSFKQLESYLPVTVKKTLHPAWDLSAFLDYCAVFQNIISLFIPWTRSENAIE